MSVATSFQNIVSNVIVQSATYLGLGAAFLWKSGLIKPAIQAIQTQGRQRHLALQTLTRSSGTQRFLALVSLSLSALGISNLSSLFFGNGFIYETHGMSCQERIAAAQNNLNLCPEAREFRDSVEAEGPVSFKCVAPSMAPRGAAAEVGSRTIFFAHPQQKGESSSTRILGQKSPTCLMLYEFKNMGQHEKIKHLFETAAFGGLSKSEFVYEIESLEFDTAMVHHDISKKCIKSGWNPEIAEQYNFGESSPVQFSASERKNWFKNSPIAKHIKPTDGDAKIKYIMLNDKIGHTALVAQRLQMYLDSLS